MPYIKFTRHEQVWQHRSVTWGESELEAFKAKCQRRAEDVNCGFDNQLYANLFAVLKDMSINDVIAEYKKWYNRLDNCILINMGSYNAPLGSIIYDELIIEANDIAEAEEDSFGDSYNYTEFYD